MRLHIGYILLTLVLVSCGPKSGFFRIDGRIKNLNQGEFYLYSPDGGMAGVDTIRVNEGKFKYETRLEGKATFVIIFPNFSEQPVFGESGTIAKMNADASRLKEMDITGNDANDAMTAFRKETLEASPSQTKDAAEEFIRTNPASIVSTYLLRRYFIDIANPDYDKAYQLSTLIAQADKDNVRMTMLTKQLATLKTAAVGSPLPSFSATDIDDKNVGRKDLRADVNVVYIWSTWNRESQTLQREMRKQRLKYEDRLAIMCVCIDANKAHCQKFIKRDSAMWSTICDGMMWDSPVLQALAITTLPGNVVADKEGTILARNLTTEEMRDKLKELLE